MRSHNQTGAAANLTLALCCLAIPGMLKANSSKTIIDIDMTSAIPIASGFSGFNAPQNLNGVEYYDPKFISAVKPLKPGWLRFPEGLPSMAYDWDSGQMNGAWITYLQGENCVDPTTSSVLTAAYVFTKAKGGVQFADFADFAHAVGANAIVSFNGYTDVHPSSALNMVLAAQSHGLNVVEWELCNEPFLYKSLFPSAGSYATAMKNPYFDEILLGNPAAVVGLFLGGQQLFVGNFLRWDNALSAYSPKYWNAVSVHVYPFSAANYPGLAKTQALLNGILAHGTTEYVDSYLAPRAGPDTPIFITELNSMGQGHPFQTYLYNGVFLAEYVARMSTHPRVKAVGIYCLYLGNSRQSGMIRAVDDYENYLFTKFKADPNFSTNTATDPNTQYQFYTSAPGWAMAVANEAINNSSHFWRTTITGGSTVPIQGYDGQPIPALYAVAYQGDNGKRYLLITNKAAEAQYVRIRVNGENYESEDPIVVASVSNSDAAAANTPTVQNTVEIVTTRERNPIIVGPYSVTRVELE